LKLIGGLNEPTAAITSKPRPYRSLGVVLVRPWIAEVDEDAVAHILRHEPAKALQASATHFWYAEMTSRRSSGVHTRRERCRTDEVREHHCDLATLGGVPWGSGRYGGNGNLRRILLAAGEFSYRSQQLESMT
jgi:hypothetical protein